MPPILLVMVGGAVGAGFRYQLGGLVLRLAGPGYPWGTWAINLVGGFLMGVLVTVLARVPLAAAEPIRLALGVGLLGGFTTFSAFSLETYAMLARGDHVGALSYAVASTAGSVLMLMGGVQLVRILA